MTGNSLIPAVWKNARWAGWVIHLALVYLDTLVLSVINKEKEDIPLFRSAVG